MTKIIETERLILREIVATDVTDLFAMDRLPEVHKYLGNQPKLNLTAVEEDIKHIQRQYAENGIGRWAVIEKKSQQLIGWSGLKFYTQPMNQHTNFYELGYRFHPQAWGKGFATESARAWLDHGFEQMQLTTIFAMTEPAHQASQKVLTKVGFQYIETFIDDEYGATTWYKINSADRK
ncbi:MAG: GNAT family N-acetyltransferase [Saprospiraceae bacterium]